jgi:hypothetical protein
MSRVGCMLLFGLALGATTSLTFGQSPTITSIEVQETKCIYIPGGQTSPCSIGPGMTLLIKGTNFGEAGGVVSLCDCNLAIVNRWKNDSINTTISFVAPNSVLSIETFGGAYSNVLPYTPLAPVIDRLDVGDCTYIPGESKHLCTVVPGAQITIKGKYFGQGPGEVATCDCSNATVLTWDPDWLVNPTPTGNTIVATVVDAECGSTVSLLLNGMWSNAVPYTTCGRKP